MESRRARIARSGCIAVWLAALISALILGASVKEPGQLLGVLIAAYLGAWGLAFAVSPAARSVLSGRFLACSTSLVIAVLPLEGAALIGAVDYRALFANPTPAWQRPENRPDLELLFTRRGNQRLERTFAGDETHRLRGVAPETIYRSSLRYDRNGFRNPRDLRAADTIVIGDSFIEGAHVADHDVITSRLSEKLAGPVANLGRIGYGPQQELEVLRRYGVELHPKTCIWAFYEGNDLDDADRYEADRESVIRSLQRQPSGTRFERSFIRNVLVHGINGWLSPEPRWPAGPYTGRFVGRAGKTVPIYFASGDYRPGEHRDQVQPGSLAIRRIRSVLTEMQAVCRQAGVRLVVVFIPTKWRVYRDLCTFEPGAVCSRWPVDDVPRVLGELVSDARGDVGFLDLTPSFVDEGARGALLYLPDDTHWSVEGHRAAALAIADFLGNPAFASRTR